MIATYIGEIQENLSAFKDYEVETYDLDCNTLPLTLDEFNKKSAFITEIATNYTKPAVYWFEITSESDTKEIYDFVAQQTNSDRKYPAYKKTFNNDESNILYVGKVKNNLAGRMRMHLGFERTGQGLQICHWPHKTGLILKLHVIYLPENLEMLANVFELKLASALNPILGKHK